MIFHHHGQALIGGIERRAFRNGPRLEHAFHLEAKIVMKMRGPMFLDNETVAYALGEVGRGLGRLVKASFALVFFQGHSQLDVALSRSGRMKKSTSGSNG